MDMTSYKSKIIKIDSSKATTYFNAYQTSFSFLIDPPINVSGDEVILFSLVNAWIPYSFYSLNKYCQYLDVLESVAGVVSSRTIIIPAGNYNAYSFLNQLITLLNVGAITYTMTYNKNNNRYYIATDATNHSAMFLFGTGSNRGVSCYKFLGMPQADVVITNIPLLSNLIVMNDIYYLQIKSDIGESNTFITGDGVDSILDIIPVNG